MSAFYRLLPAWRHGASTPWGGDALRRLYGLATPDDRTGEALVASTLPGLESKTPDGRTLTEIAGGPLPLLLKLIDAREALSVQVHPDDAYAAAHERGKRGKTEAWLILHAEPGAKLVYGLMPGTDTRALSQRDIEARLRWVQVSAGDVLYIPAGMVHAIGAGIVLYEIQQSSDVTYRFWDWGRLDAQGNARQLHWDDACAVARPDLQMDKAAGHTRVVPGGTVTRYLDTAFFSLERLAVDGRMALPAQKGFRFLTALGEGRIVAGGESEALRPADTFYLPPDGAEVGVEGKLEVLVSGGVPGKRIKLD